ncbi:MAG TPA: GNAT family protein [Candidatus Limnocylindrales bacterium]|nr:GNAT family protein [Candidatus Limnocylindrales bacterium]
MTAGPFELRDLWPLYDLVVRTGQLELRYPTEAELPAFADIIEAGLHPKGEMPFGMAWTDAPTTERNLASYQWWVGSRGRWSVDSWTLTLGVWEHGVPVGFQDVRAERYPVFRTVHTGSWLGMSHQGRGIGKLMRQAALGLAFDHLGARFAETSAFLDNHASTKVSIGVGYEKNGFGELAPHGIPRATQNFRMSLDGWRSRPRPEILVEGLDGCRAMFGLEAGAAPQT